MNTNRTAAHFHPVLSCGSGGQMPGFESKEMPADELRPRVVIRKQPLHIGWIEQLGIEHEKEDDRSEERTDSGLD